MIITKEIEQLQVFSLQKRKIIVILFLVDIFFTSCASHKISTKNFFPCPNFTDLNGTYLNRDGELSRVFPIKSDIVHFFTCEFTGKDSLKLTYRIDSDLKTICYKGKFKKNFFEIYLSNKFIPIPFLFFLKDVDRLRIGRNEKTDLLIQHYYDHIGWVLLFAAGDTEEDEYSFQNIHNFTELRPCFLDNKWGFTDSTENIAIEPRYNFVEFFNNNVSRVKLHNKWGLINKVGVEITPIKYDTIYSFYSNGRAKVLLNKKEGYLDINGKEIIAPIYEKACFNPGTNLVKVTLNGKEGYLDSSGNEIIPPRYDFISDFTDTSSIGVFCENGKYGYRTITDILCPPVFDKASNEFSSDLTDICIYARYNKTPYYRVIYDNNPYLLDKDMYMYKYKCLKGVRKGFIVFDKISAKDLK